MSDGPAPFSQSTTQGQGHALAIYEAAAAEVGDDTTGSAIIQQIMVLTQAAADGGATEVGTGEETDIGRSEGGHTDREGSVDARTVLARAGTQPSGNNATTDTCRTEELQPLLIPKLILPRGVPPVPSTLKNITPPLMLTSSTANPPSISTTPHGPLTSTTHTFHLPKLHNLIHKIF